MNGISRSVTIVGVSGSAVTLTLASPVVSTDTVTVAYTAPVTNPVQDVAGNDAASFTAAAVTNNTPPADTTAPSPDDGDRERFDAGHQLQRGARPSVDTGGSAFDVQVGAAEPSTTCRSRDRR